MQQQVPPRSKYLLVFPQSVQNLTFFSRRNLCYVKIFEDNQPITCAAFDMYYKGLLRPEIKVRVYSISTILRSMFSVLCYPQKWNDLSKASKSQSTKAIFKKGSDRFSNSCSLLRLLLCCPVPDVEFQSKSFPFSTLRLLDFLLKSPLRFGRQMHQI